MLKRNSRGSIILPSGEHITPKMQQEYKNAVRRANNERARMMAELPPEAKKNYKEFGATTDFHIKKRSASFGKITNLADFKTRLHNAKDIASGRWENRQIRASYSNFMRSLKQTFNSDADYLNALVRAIDPKVLKKEMDAGRVGSTGYVYYEPIQNRRDATTKPDEVTKYEAIRLQLESLVNPKRLLRIQKEYLEV